MNTLGFKRCLFNGMEKFQDFSNTTPPLACQVSKHD